MLVKIKNYLTGLSLTGRFNLTSLVIIIFSMIGIGWWVNIQIANGVIHRTSATAALFADSFIASNLQELATSGQITPQHLQKLDSLIDATSLGQQIVAFKVWNTAGVVQFSTDKAIMGKTFTIEGGLAQALSGDVASSISRLTRPENISLKVYGSRLIETYIPVRLAGTDQIIAVAEFYQKVDELQREILNAEIRSWLLVAGVGALIFALLSGFVKRASDTIDRQKVALSNQVDQLTRLLQQNQELHARVRRAAASVTTLNERLLRRIGSEIHDGPAQDLSLALLNLDSITEQGGEIPTNGHRISSKLEAVQSVVQNALKELRGISTGLSLPELAELSLQETIKRAVRAHERRTNSKVKIDLGELPEVCPLPVKITIYRLIQEALHNAYRHAGGIGQSVAVQKKDDQVSVEVSDKGPGFDLAQASRWENHLGIAGMRERVESLGGDFSIESSPGLGTKVHASLNLLTGGARYER